MSATISVDALYAQLGLTDSPAVVDLRNAAELAHLPRLIPGSVVSDPGKGSEWAGTLPHARQLAVCCSRNAVAGTMAVAELAANGFPVFLVAGGIEAWIDSGYPTVRARNELSAPGGSRWITRERPKIDRLACPWLVRRFIDPHALFFYTAPHCVRSEAAALGAEPYDIADVTFSHRGPRCSFDAFLAEFDLHDPILSRLADIVRAADTGELGHAREAPGLLAISLGLSATIADDIVLLEQAMPIYDALYAWCKKAHHEAHSWPQQNPRQ
jgi:rhodanese-related sulfurtransferase